LIIKHKKRIENFELNKIKQLFFKEINLQTSKKKHFWKTFTNLPFKKYILAYSNNQIVGVFVILERNLNYYGKNIKVCGLSYMAINKNYQNKGISKIFVNYLFDNFKNFDLFLGFARKKMDMFWSLYDFIGITNFGTISLNPKNIKTGKTFKYSKEKIYKKDIPTIKKLYKNYSKHKLLNINRNDELWSFYLSEGKKDLDLIKISYNKKIIGYIIFKNDILYEAIYNFKFEKCFLYFIRNEFLKFPNIIFNTCLNEPIANALKNFNYVVNEKYVWDGGHVIKIYDIEKILKKIKNTLEKRLFYSQILKFSITIYNIKFKYKNFNLSLKVMPNFNKNNNDLFEITKLIFGQRYSNNPLISVIFPEYKSNVPYIDQF
jgi:hypothetical protein